MFMKKWVMAACVLLTAFVLASCGKQEDTAGGTAETVTESSGTEASSKNEEPASNTAGSAAGSASAKDGDTNGGDFALTGQKWEWVEWDSDGDGDKEQISFEYIDNGDEAESVILVKLEGEDSPEAYIDRARRIVRIFAEEDEEGPYLQVEYNYENKLTEKADMECIIRIQNKAIVIE